MKLFCTLAGIKVFLVLIWSANFTPRKDLIAVPDFMIKLLMRLSHWDHHYDHVN